MMPNFIPNNFGNLDAMRRLGGIHPVHSGPVYPVNMPETGNPPAFGGQPLMPYQVHPPTAFGTPGQPPIGQPPTAQPPVAGPYPVGPIQYPGMQSPGMPNMQGPQGMNGMENLLALRNMMQRSPMSY